MTSPAPTVVSARWVPAYRLRWTPACPVRRPVRWRQAVTTGRPRPVATDTRGGVLLAGGAIGSDRGRDRAMSAALRGRVQRVRRRRALRARQVPVCRLLWTPACPRRSVRWRQAGDDRLSEVGGVLLVGGAVWLTLLSRTLGRGVRSLRGRVRRVRRRRVARDRSSGERRRVSGAGGIGSVRRLVRCPQALGSGGCGKPCDTRA